MKHEFHKKYTADVRRDIMWVDEVCIHCGKSRELCKEDEECSVRSNHAIDFGSLFGASITGEKKQG